MMPYVVSTRHCSEVIFYTQYVSCSMIGSMSWSHSIFIFCIFKKSCSPHLDQLLNLLFFCFFNMTLYCQICMEHLFVPQPCPSAHTNLGVQSFQPFGAKCSFPFLVCVVPLHTSVSCSYWSEFVDGTTNYMMPRLFCIQYNISVSTATRML